MSKTTAEFKPPRAASKPVFYNGFRIGSASTEEKATELLEQMVLAVTGYSNAVGNRIVHKQLAWNKMAKIYGHEGFEEDTLVIDHQDDEFRFNINNLPND